MEKRSDRSGRLLPAAAAVIFAIFAAVLYFTCVQPLRERRVIVTEDPNDMVSFVRLHTGDELRQTFQTDAAIDSLFYYIGSFDIADQPGAMRAELYAVTDGTLLAGFDIDLSQTENSWFNMLELSGIAHPADGLYEAVFTVTDMGSGSEYAFCETAHNVSGLGQTAVINGETGDFSLYIYCGQTRDMAPVRIFYIVMCVLLGLVLLASGLLMRSRGRAAWFAAVLLTLGILATFAIPYNTIHDIEVHTVNTFARATALVHGRPEMSPDPAQTVRASESRGHMRYYIVGPDQYYYYLTETFAPVQRELVNVHTRAPGEGQFFENLPQITATLAARALGLGRYMTIHAAELMQLCLFVLLCTLAVRFSPLPDTIAMMCLFPMALRSGGSFSYDGFIIPVGLLLLALMLRVILKGEKVSRRLELAMMALSLLLAPHRMIYVPMGLLLCCAPADRWRTPARKWGYILLLVGLSGVAALAGQWAYITSKLAESGVATGWENMQVYSYSLFMEKPLEGLWLLVRSMVLQFPTQLSQSVSGLYNLQWPDWIALPLFFGMALAIPAGQCRELKPSFRWAALIVTLMVMVLGYVAHIRQTIVGAETIMGVHGKYFIPMFPALAAACAGLVRKRPDGRLLVWLTAAADCFFLVWFMATAMAR